MILVEILLALIISSFLMYAILGLLAGTLLHKQFYSDTFNEWQKRARIFSTIESRIANAGLGVPPGEAVEDIFRFTPTGASILPGWTDAIEILSSNDIPMLFQDISGDQISRGEQMRVLSTHITASNVRIIPASADWGPREIRTVNILKPQYESYVYHIVPDELSSWITTPSFGRPVIIKNITAPYDSSSGSVLLQNPLYVSADWHGIDMIHSFRISYFHVEAETLYIRDSDKKDTTNAIPSASLHKEPVVDDVLSACFELNKTTKILSCWFLIRSRNPMIKPGIPHGWPLWAYTQPNVSSNKLKVITYSWRFKNIK
jgi:hypothetical protein